MFIQPIQECTRTTQGGKILSCNKSLCKNNFSNIEIRILNELPQSIKEIPVLYKFKKTLRTYLLDHCFCSIDEFLILGIS
jgi:hypothetical protein